MVLFPSGCHSITTMQSSFLSFLSTWPIQFVVLSRPTFLFPSGCHSIATMHSSFLSFLSTWPIQFVVFKSSHFSLSFRLPLHRYHALIIPLLSKHLANPVRGLKSSHFSLPFRLPLHRHHAFIIPLLSKHVANPVRGF